MHLAENLSINTMKKNFASNLLSQDSIEQDYLSKNLKSVFEVFNKNINFSTEFECRVSLKIKQQFLNCYSSVHFVLLKMTISSPMK